MKTETEQIVSEVIAALEAASSAPAHDITVADLALESQVQDVEAALAAYKAYRPAARERLIRGVRLLETLDGSPACRAWLDEVWQQAGDAWL